jgi:NADPH:quinone reductase-like Zn-dependent oxidoreductase
MRRWRIDRNGPPKQALSIQDAVPVPAVPTGSNLLVKVTHAGLNPADIDFMGGGIPSWIPIRRQPTPGIDFVGTVLAVGPAVDADAHGIEVGVLVCGGLIVSQIAFGAGSLTQYVSVPAAQVALVPKLFLGNPAQAVGMGCAGQTAALVVREFGDFKAGQRVLINGASGGVGLIILQVLKNKGASVVAVSSGKNEALVRKHGADEVWNFLFALLSDAFG